MNILTLPRQRGKSTFILRWAQMNPNHVILVASQDQVEHLKRLARSLGIKLERDQIATVTQPRENHEKIYGIDNLEHVLSLVLGTVEVATFSPPQRGFR